MLHDLEQRLLKAHAQRDGEALITGYTQAADAQDDLNAACYFLTYAYVFALETGDVRVGNLHARLAEHGRV